jgi:hypothetical protein
MNDEDDGSGLICIIFFTIVCFLCSVGGSILWEVLKIK